MNFDTDIRFLKGVGEKRALLLNKLGIDTVGALLRFYPRRYEDWNSLKNIGECSPGEQVCIRARLVTEVSDQYIRQNMTVYKFVVEDKKASRMSITLFNNPYLANRMHKDSEYLFYGKMGNNPFWPEMSSPEISETGAAGIRPVYSATAGLSARNIEKLVKNALSVELDDDPLPGSLRDRNGLCDLRYAFDNIHFPRAQESLDRARHRLVFEELFILQTSLLLLKGKNRVLAGCPLVRNCKQEFLSLLPFPLTGAQSRVIDECVTDMMSGRPMNRLIEGDVGCGKTAVAAALCYISAKNGYQSALMVPTEILAEQHFSTLSAMLENSGVSCTLLTGSMTKKQKTSVKESLRNGKTDIVIGTHALLTDDVQFCRLALVITDEQHRFGVAQRAKLAAKGVHPHTLVMSATPIPRTLALILYGDLDISIIDEYPRGRQRIESYCVPSSYHARVYAYIKKHLDAGRQGYIVCPLVEENEQLDITSVEEYYASLKDGAFKGYRLGLLHGKLRSKEKDAVMRAFERGEIQLLICTTVVEVGIDVPNAAVMVIENAERFGLSQLHQLRGRIGRGPYQSTCILISDLSSGVTKERLDVIRNNLDGFKIADEDLKLRGPGDFLGNRQHGLPTLKIADLSADLQTLQLAGKEAAALLKDDPGLQAEENRGLRREITALYKKLNEN